MVIVVFINPQVTLAYQGLSSGDIAALNNYPEWVGGSAACNTLTLVGGGGSTAALSQEQQTNAATVIGIAKTEDLGQQGALIGVMVALAESGLRELANSSVPLSEQNPNAQGVGNQGTSLGIFQQQIEDNWSTISSDPTDSAAVDQLMTPAYNAEAFFGSPPGTVTSSALSKGLQNIPNWQTLQPWIVAQEVQGSEFGNGQSPATDPTYGENYHDQLPEAQNLIAQYYASSAALPLPVAFTAAGTGGNGTVASSCSAGIVAGSIVQTAIGLAWPDDTHGTTPTAAYAAAMQQYNAVGFASTGGLGNDCGVFVGTVMHASGADPNYPDKYTPAQAQYVIDHPNLYTVIYPALSTAQLEPGDILILNQGTTISSTGVITVGGGGGAAGHTFIYVGPQGSNGYNEASASLPDRSANLGFTQLVDSRGSYLIARLK